MKSGISGTVTARIAADSQLRGRTQMRISGGASADEDHLGQVAREVRLERVDALDGRRRQLARLLVLQVARARQQQMAHEPFAQAGHDARRAVAPGHLEARGDQAAGDAHGGQPPQRRRNVRQRRAAQEDARDDVREQRRLRDDERGRDQTERDRRRPDAFVPPR